MRHHVNFLFYESSVGVCRCRGEITDLLFIRRQLESVGRIMRKYLVSALNCSEANNCLSTNMPNQLT